MSWIVWLINIALWGLLAGFVTDQLGMIGGFFVYVLITVLVSLLAGWLLKTAELGAVTWKNQLVGWLTPWTRIVGGGSLPVFLFKNGIASVIFAGVIIFLHGQGMTRELVAVSSPSEVGEAGQNPWWRVIVTWLTILGWIVMCLGWSAILNSYFRNQSEPITTLLTHRRGLIPFALPPVALAISVYLRMEGYPGYALATVGIPLLFVLAPVILMLLAILIHFAMGKPLRWN